MNQVIDEIQVNNSLGIDNKAKKIARFALRRFARFMYDYFARYLPISYMPFSFGLTKPFRGFLCRFFLKKCGKNINIERRACLFGSNIEIGDNSGIGINARLYSGGGIIIGNDVMMGEDVVILSQNHKHSDITRSMRGTGYELAPVIIEDDVWIGLRVIILPGVRISRSSIVGAGAVVTKNVPPFSIVAGNPARVIKTRDGRPLVT
jgi:maltose O-acetyltransferase